MNDLSPISEPLLETMMEKGQSLDFIGAYWFKKNLVITQQEQETYDTHTPLTYSIEQNKKDLFIKILKYGVDVNLSIPDWEISPLAYALRNPDNFYLQSLLAHPQIDVKQKRKDDDLLNYVLSSNYDFTLKEAEALTNVNIFLEHLKKHQALDHFFEKNIFKKIISCKYIDSMVPLLLKKLPPAVSQTMLNESLELPQALFLKLRHKKPEMNKIINYLEKDKIFENNETVFLNLVKPSPDKRLREHEIESIAAMFLKKDFSVDIPNQNGLDVLACIQDKEYYQHHVIEKNFKNLSVELEEKPKSAIKHKI